MKKSVLVFFIVSIIASGVIMGSGLNSLGLQSLPANELTTVYDLSSYWWTETEVISTESTSASTDPSLIVDNLGNIHIAWWDFTDYDGSGFDQDIFYKVWNSSTSSWSLTEVVSTESTGHSNNPRLAVDELNNVHIVWHDWTNYLGAGSDADIFYKLWNSSTSTWSLTEVVSTESTGDSADPSFTVDQFGSIYVAWNDWTDDDGEADPDIYYKLWNSSTSSWSLTEVVSSESTAWSQFPSLAVDTFGTVHIAWYDLTDYDGAGSDADIFYKRWDISTSSWSLTEVVSTESTGSSNNPSLATDSAGNVYLAWYDFTDYDGAGSDTDIFYKRRDSSTSIWSITEVVSTESTDDSQNPSLAVDTFGTVHIAWLDQTDIDSSGTDHDIFYKMLDSSTSSWSLTEVASTDSTSGSFHPSLAVDVFDIVHIAWTDQTDYNSSGTDSDIFYNRFVGSPLAPTYITASPIFSTSGIINVDWNDVARASTYYLYRETTYITSSSGLVPLAIITNSNYTDTISVDGAYYYAVVAGNVFGNSSLSDVAPVQVEISANDLLPFISNEGLVLFGILLVTQILFFAISIFIRRKK